MHRIRRLAARRRLRGSGDQEEPVSLSLRRPGDAPLRIGHRGAAALAPENTLESFAKAIELGVDGVEFDVVPGARGLEIAHDARLDGSPALEIGRASCRERVEISVSAER